MFDGTPFQGMDEKGIIRERLADLSPLPALVEEAYIQVKKEIKREKYNKEQDRRRQSVLVNMRIHELWRRMQPDNPWKIVDSAYSHFQDDITGMRVDLHPADRGRVRVFKPANTNTSHFRFLQSACRSAEDIQGMMSPEGAMVPDLTDVSGQLIWYMDKGEASVWFVKPLDGEKRKSAYECPVLRKKESIRGMRFEHNPEENFMLEEIENDIKEDRRKHEAQSKRQKTVALQDTEGDEPKNSDGNETKRK